MSFIDGDFRDYVRTLNTGLMQDRNVNNECENCGCYPCNCKKSDTDFCPDCHAIPCSCDDNIWMPKKLHRKLERQASKKGLTGKQKEKFVYGTLSKVERRLNRRKSVW